MKKEDETEFKYNDRGAKVFRDPLRHTILEIPKIRSRKEKGAIYDVLSVDMFWNPIVPTATINENGTPVLYRLPEWYSEWVEYSLILSSKGPNPFPSKVEFGYIIPDKQYYADILNDNNDHSFK